MTFTKLSQACHAGESQSEKSLPISGSGSALRQGVQVPKQGVFPESFIGSDIPVGVEEDKVRLKVSKIC